MEAWVSLLLVELWINNTSSSSHTCLNSDSLVVQLGEELIEAEQRIPAKYPVRIYPVWVC